MIKYWILDRNNQVIEARDIYHHKAWWSVNLKQTIIGLNHLPDGTIISTRFLTMNWEMGFENPVLFQTIIQKNPKFNDFQENYTTYEDAINGHFVALNEVLLSTVNIM